MRTARSRAGSLAVACLAVGVVFANGPAGGAVRDDTATLQAQLDAGGNVFLPKLPDGRCYATRGLWVSRDDTTITSDGACIVALGPGPARIATKSGRPVDATAVFFVNHSDIRASEPIRVTISDVHIVVPNAKRMTGVAIFGHEVTLDHVTIGGEPTTDVVVGGGGIGSAGTAQRITIRGCTLTGGRRNVVFVAGPIGLHLEGSTLSGARGLPRGAAGAGLNIRAADRGQPVLDVDVADNTIADNAGPGILLDLDPRDGPPVIASGIELDGNHVLRNARRTQPSRRGGIVVVGGENDGAGRLTLTANAVHANRGPGVLGRRLRLRVAATGNDLGGNAGGATRGVRPIAVRAAAAAPTWLPDAPMRAAADDTQWLQTRLDARGGTIFLPKLPDGRCYATRGLWVSHDDTTITSDGACISSLGPGPVRLHSVDGDPIASNAVFFVSRSRPTAPAPIRDTIENLRIVVPNGQEMYGVATLGHEVTLSHLEIAGSPIDDVLIGGRANGNGYVSNVSVEDSTLEGAMRNAVTAFGVIGLHVVGDTIEGVRDLPAGQPAAGIDVEPDDRSEPTLDVVIASNTIVHNAGPGILLELDSNSGPAVLADDLRITGNTISGNALQRSPPKRAGVVIAGGQDVVEGTLVLSGNTIENNGGPGILATRLKLVVDATDNVVQGNEDGASVGL